MDINAVELTIKAVADRTGVSVHTLRAWEKRYGVPSPARDTDNRYRLYDEHDIADVLFLKQQGDAGVAPAQASALLRQRQIASTATLEVGANQPSYAMRSSLIDAFAKADEPRARQILDEAFALFTSEQVALQVIEPAMHEIGERWKRNEMAIWQEHLASNLVQQKLLAILQALPALPASAPALVAACAPSEKHQIGLTIFAWLARRQGWRIVFLGQDTPLDDLANLAPIYKPNATVVSITTVVGLASLIPWLDPAKRPATPIVIGGRMANTFPELRPHLPGQYLGEDATAAINHLTSIRPDQNYWSPTMLARDTVERLRAQRLGIADKVASELFKAFPNLSLKGGTSHLNKVTLSMVDSLSCALAFDVPDLMDEHSWLAAPPTMPVLIGMHMRIFQLVLGSTFTKEQNRFTAPLIERMHSHLASLSESNAQ